MDAHCLKCLEKREIENPEEVILKNGRPATNAGPPNNIVGLRNGGKPKAVNEDYGLLFDVAKSATDHRRDEG